MTSLNRRQFVSAAAAGGMLSRFWLKGAPVAANEFHSAIERPVVGYIGTGIRYQSLIEAAEPYCSCAALCDVDQRHLHEARDVRAEIYEGHDYMEAD